MSWLMLLLTGPFRGHFGSGDQEGPSRRSFRQDGLGRVAHTQYRAQPRKHIPTKRDPRLLIRDVLVQENGCTFCMDSQT